MGHPLLAFLETGIITRFFFFSSTPPPSPLFFHFVIGSLFNLVKKIGLAWERQNSFGDRICCFRVVCIVCFVVVVVFWVVVVFFPIQEEKCQLVPKPHKV